MARFSPLYGDETAILALIRNSDEDALVRLFQQNRRPVASFVLRNNGTHDDAEDMLQEALVILWERVRSGRFEQQSKLGTYILGIVKNLWLQRLAKKQRESPLVDNVSVDPPILQEIIDEEDAGELRKAMHKIGEPCRTILLLFYGEDLSMEEIADKMGFANAQTAKSKKYQCKKLLRQVLEGVIDQ